MACGPFHHCARSADDRGEAVEVGLAGGREARRELGISPGQWGFWTWLVRNEASCLPRWEWRRPWQRSFRHLPGERVVSVVPGAFPVRAKGRPTGVGRRGVPSDGDSYTFRNPVLRKHPDVGQLSCVGHSHRVTSFVGGGWCWRGVPSMGPAPLSADCRTRPRPGWAAPPVLAQPPPAGICRNAPGCVPSTESSVRPFITTCRHVGTLGEAQHRSGTAAMFADCYCQRRRRTDRTSAALHGYWTVAALRTQPSSPRGHLPY